MPLASGIVGEGGTVWTSRFTRTSRWRAALLVCVAAAFVFGISISNGWLIIASSAKFEAGSKSQFELLRILRFMAAVKMLFALVASAIAYWRLGFSIHRGAAFVLVSAVTLMATAPPMIWSGSHIGIGAALFHSGLLFFLALAWMDRGRA
jgi:hypothetical protein